MTNEGFLLINKPAGVTSHDVVDRVRRITGIRKVGHAGTLDPFATGLLIIGVGRSATREMQTLQGLDKTYEATFVLGAHSDTDDKDGVIKPNACKNVTNQTIDAVLATMMGEIEQIPPMYAAIKIKGKKLYEIAREGKTIERKPRKITIYELKRLADVVQKQDTAEVRVFVSCSTGTYIRAIARDLGSQLGGGGYVSTLTRTSIGLIPLSKALTLEEIEEKGWQSNLIDQAILKTQI